MKPHSLLCLVFMLGGPGCARENPAFDGGASGTGGADAGASGGQLTSAGPGGQSASASGSASQGQTSGASSAASVDDTGDGPGGSAASDPGTSESGEAMEEVTGDGPPEELIVYSTQPIVGSFASDPEHALDIGSDVCREVANTLLPELDCDRTWPVLGMFERPVEGLLDAPGGTDLLEGIVVAPDGTLVAEDFIALSQAEVTPDFANAVTDHLPDAVGDIGMWWGQSADGMPAQQCGNWHEIQFAGTLVFWDEASGNIVTEDQGCGNAYHMLCVCF
ncbi:MAG: hypothetical protein AAF799_08325 [Myxococcota bacterium]